MLGNYRVASRVVLSSTELDIAISQSSKSEVRGSNQAKANFSPRKNTGKKGEVRRGEGIQDILDKKINVKAKQWVNEMGDRRTEMRQGARRESKSVKRKWGEIQRGT
jgi:hypothetical protein